MRHNTKKLQSYFGHEKNQLHYIDSFVLNMNTKYFVKDLKMFGDLVDFSNLNE